MSDIELLGVRVVTDICIFNLLLRDMSDSKREKRVIGGAVTNDEGARRTTNKKGSGRVPFSEGVINRVEGIIILLVRLPVQFAEGNQPIGKLLDGVERSKAVNEGAESIDVDQIRLTGLWIG